MPNETQSSEVVKEARRNDKRREDWSGVKKSKAQVKIEEADEARWSSSLTTMTRDRKDEKSSPQLDIRERPD